MRLLDILSRGSTLDDAAARLGADPELARLAAEEYERLGLLQLPRPRTTACTTCAADGQAPLPIGCAGCPFAPR